MTDEKLYPAHANSFMDTKEGWTYKASNVHKCESCGSHLLKRQLAWPPNEWQCGNDKCQNKVLINA